MKKKYFLLLLLIFFESTSFKSSTDFASYRGISSSESGKLLSDWIALHLKCVRSTKGLSQGQLFRHFAYTSIALYESIVNGNDQYVSLGGQLQELGALSSLAGDKKTCWEASANASIATMLRAFYNSNPSALQKIDSLESYYYAKLQKDGYTSENAMMASGYGSSIAMRILEWAKDDGFAKTYPPYELPKGPGLWEPTPPLFAAPLAPYAQHNRTCVKNSIANTLPAVPLAFSTDKGSPFYKMVNEVYNASQNLTDDQKAIALFWDDFPDGRYYGVAGHWASIFRQIIQVKNLSLMEASMAYSKMNMAMFDSFISCFKAKYTYNLLRPVTYIQKNMSHPDWNPLIVTPAHPEYPAAHASMSMAAAAALTTAMGNNISFTDHSYDDLGFEPRKFKNFEEAGKEAGLSRLYGGIHYRSSIEAGYVLGAKVASNQNAVSFKKKSGDSRH